LSLLRRFLPVAYAVLVVLVIGVIGYMAIEGWSFLDALYMTVITVSTVGYSEVHGLSTAGRVFTIVLIIGGVSVMLYALTSIVQYLTEGYLGTLLGRSRMKGKLSRLKGHVILCGYGRVGQEVASAFSDEKTDFVVIEQSQEAHAKAAFDGCLCLLGDATMDSVLEEAGIHSARALVAAVGSDADNIYITLSARGMNPHLAIVARAGSEESESKLRRAGADRIIFPLRVGGRRMAMSALHPLVVDFIDTTLTAHGRELVLEEVTVGPRSPLAGATIAQGQAQAVGTAILAVKKKHGDVLTNPPPDTLVETGDQLVVIGSREHLRLLEGPP
jgi:voltage-gated potassium channel